jgi:hypothetical protein
MVDNPRLADLKSIRQRLGAELRTLEGLLKQAASDVGGKGQDQSWVGQTAERWQGEVHGRRAGIKSEMGRLVAELDRAIAGCPAKCSLNEAKMYRMDRLHG